MHLEEQTSPDANISEVLDARRPERRVAFSGLRHFPTSTATLFEIEQWVGEGRGFVDMVNIDFQRGIISTIQRTSFKWQQPKQNSCFVRAVPVEFYLTSWPEIT